MNEVKRGRRRCVRIGGVLMLGIVAALGLRFAIGLYLESSRGRTAVAQQLETLIGMPVEVSHVDVGSNSSSVKFRVMDPALAGRPDAEVLSVESATADVSLTDYLGGRAQPKELSFRGANLTLRIDADGRILTTLPHFATGSNTLGAAPAITFDGGQIRLCQEGKSDFVLSGIHLKLTPRDGALLVSGVIDDPNWGQWLAFGEIDRTSKSGWIELTCDDSPFATERMRSIPFVSASIWDRVGVDGRGAARVRLAYTPETDFQFDVEVQPRDASFSFPDAGLTLTNTAGTIRARGSKVELIDCRSMAAGGEVALDGCLNFAPDAITAEATVVALRLDVTAVPTSWNLPREFGGRLSGTAELVLRIDTAGRIDSSGSRGRGRIEGARIGGFPTAFDLQLQPDRNGLRLNEVSPQPTRPPVSATDAPIRNAVCFALR